VRDGQVHGAFDHLSGLGVELESEAFCWRRRLCLSLDDVFDVAPIVAIAVIDKVEPGNDNAKSGYD
jgi:hypothetical protein